MGTTLFRRGRKFKMKKSFILFNDSLDILDDITIEQAGKLFIAIRNFNIGKLHELDAETKLLFLHFKNQFIRDAEKYKTKSEANSNNGSKGGLAKVANASKSKRTLKSVATLADTDTVTDTDKDTEKDKDTIKIQSVIAYFTDNGFSSKSAETFFYYYESANWTDSNGKKVKNWKQKARGVWFKDENKISEAKQTYTPTQNTEW